MLIRHPNFIDGTLRTNNGYVAGTDNPLADWNVVGGVGRSKLKSEEVDHGEGPDSDSDAATDWIATQDQTGDWRLSFPFAYTETNIVPVPMRLSWAGITVTLLWQSPGHLRFQCSPGSAPFPILAVTTTDQHVIEILKIGSWVFFRLDGVEISQADLTGQSGYLDTPEVEFIGDGQESDSSTARWLIYPPTFEDLAVSSQAITISTNTADGGWQPLVSDLVTDVLSTAGINDQAILVDDGDNGDGSFIAYFQIDASALPAGALATQLLFSAQYNVSAEGDMILATVDGGWALKDNTGTIVVAATSLINTIFGDGGKTATETANVSLGNVSKTNLSLYQVGIYGKIAGSNGSGNAAAFVNSLSLSASYTLPAAGGGNSNGLSMGLGIGL